MVWQQLFFFTMSRKFTISQFVELKDAFLKLEEPKDLCKLLNINIIQLIKLTKNPGYKAFESHHKGKKRVIAEPNGDLKDIQQKLNYYLQAVYFFHKPDCVHGFIKSPKNEKQKCTIISNAKQHCDKKYVINADIFRFFPSITGTMVRDVFLNSPFNFNSNLASAIALLCINKNWLPTGAPTSPAISNLVCLILDNELINLAGKYEYTYTRYADDITFSGDNPPGDRIKSELTSVLANSNFKLNYKKYRVLTKQSRQTVTGIVVNEKPNVNRKYIKQLRAIQHDIKKNGVFHAAIRHLDKEGLNERDIHSFQYSVEAKIRFVNKVRIE